MKHKHKWMKYAFGAQLCSICGINRASTGYKYPSTIKKKKRYWNPDLPADYFVNPKYKI